MIPVCRWQRAKDIKKQEKMEKYSVVCYYVMKIIDFYVNEFVLIMEFYKGSWKLFYFCFNRSLA
jgi:hypothetical protein